MTWAGVDPEAMGLLAVALERAAATIEERHRALSHAAGRPGVPAGSLSHLPQVAAWCRAWSRDVRHRAVVAASNGRRWRHESAWGHLWDVGRAGVRGAVDGSRSIVSGAQVGAHLVASTVTEPQRLAAAARRDGVAGMADLVRDDVAERVVTAAAVASALDPMAPAARFVRRAGRDGGWAAVEDGATDVGHSIPGAVLTLAGTPEAEAASFLRNTAPVARRLSDAANISALAPEPAPAVSTTTVRRLVPLSVPVQPGRIDGRRVAIDPEDGRFVVLSAGPEPEAPWAGVRHRWGDLGRDERRALEDAGLTDHHGRLVTG